MVFGVSDRPGLPIGPLFYFVGFFHLLFTKKEAFGSCIVILLFCLLFWVLVIFSGLITYSCIKFIRRIKSHRRKEFYTDAAGMSSKDAVGHALRYVIDSGHSDDGNIGIVYLSSTDHRFKWATIHLLADGRCSIRIGESDPGYIREGYFARYMSNHDFSIAHWKIGKRKQLIVPPEDFDRVPAFIDLLYKEYYNCTGDYLIRAEALVM